MKKTKILKGILTMAAALVFAVFAYSANAGDNQLKVTDGFDRYKFNSVTAEIWPPNDEYEVGSTIPFKVQITSGNDYPIVNGNVYVKIFKRQGEAITNEEGVNFHETKQIENELENGGYLIDQFNALENISLDAKGTKTLEFNWQAPKYLPAGEYRIVTFYQSSRKFNLLGLPFTEDVVGNTYDFTIKNSNKEGTVEFDRNNIKVNDEEFDLIGFSKNYPKGEAVKVEAPLKNTTDKSQTVTLNYNLYYWDQLLEQNKIKSEKETVTLSPNETKTITHNVEGNEYPVNFLEMKADWQDTHSIINIRFTRDAHEKARNNFASLSSFPLVTNQPVTLFTTAHAVKQFAPVIPDLMLLKGKDALQDETYTLTLALKDRNKKILASYTYTGSIGGEVTGYEADYTPKEDYNYVTLEASVKNKEGNIIDETSLVFDCKAINPNACSQKAQDALEAATGKLSMTKTAKTIMVVLFSLLVVLVIAYAAYKKKSGLSLFLLVLCGSLLLGAQGARGETIFNSLVDPVGTVDKKVKQTVFQGFLKDMAYKSVSVYDYYDYWWSPIKDVDSKVTYTAASTVDDGATLKAGDVFYISDQGLTNDSSIYWVVKGYSVDSPPGCWIDEYSIDNVEKCRRWKIYDVARDFEDGYLYYYKLNGFMFFKKPKIEIITDGPVSCVPFNGSDPNSINKWKCTTSGVGTAKVFLNYFSTSGRFGYDSHAWTNNPSYPNERKIKNNWFQTKLECDSKGYDNPYDSKDTKFETLIVDFASGGSATCKDVRYSIKEYENKIPYAYKKQCEECSLGSDNGLLAIPPAESFTWTYTVSSNPSGNKLSVDIYEMNGADGKVDVENGPSGSKVTCNNGNCSYDYPSAQTVTLTPSITSPDTTLTSSSNCTSLGSNRYSCVMNAYRNASFTFNKSGTCIPNCDCAESTCKGSTCSNGCGGECEGKRENCKWIEVSPE